MNTDHNVSFNKRAAKQAAEHTALDGCREDMSDVSFAIGKTSYSLILFALIAVFAFIFGRRILVRRMVANPEYQLSVTDMVFWGFIGCLLIGTIAATVIMHFRPTITVSGKTIFYNGNCWTSDEITCVKCSGLLEMVEVCAGGRKVLSFPWELDHSEMLIAWAKKCGIPFEDNRVGRR